MRATPSKDLKEKIVQTLPLLKEARAHNNRSLLNDLSTALVKDLEVAILKRALTKTRSSIGLSDAKYALCYCNLPMLNQKDCHYLLAIEMKFLGLLERWRNT